MSSVAIASTENINPQPSTAQPVRMPLFAPVPPRSEVANGGTARVSRLHLSTARRFARLNALVVELALRDMNHADVARFFPCSLSAARDYMHNLLDAAVVSVPFSPQGKVHMDSAKYRLSANELIVKDFLDSQGGDRISSRAHLQREDASGPRHFHILSDDVKFDVKIYNFPARRDPLVAALFGERAAQGKCANQDCGAVRHIDS